MEYKKEQKIYSLRPWQQSKPSYIPKPPYFLYFSHSIFIFRILISCSAAGGRWIISKTFSAIRSCKLGQWWYTFSYTGCWSSYIISHKLIFWFRSSNKRRQSCYPIYRSFGTSFYGISVFFKFCPWKN